MNPSTHPTILFVAMPGAVHTGRWIEQIINTGWDVHLFSPSATSDLTIHQTVPEQVKVHLAVKQSRSKVQQTGLPYPFERGDRFRLGVTNLYETFKSRPRRLADLIKKLKPDIVHSLQMQGPSYLTLEAKHILEQERITFPKWIYSSWGSDIYLFASQSEHLDKITSVLDATDYLITDCERDISLARQYGFRGEVLGVFPTGGGFEVEKQQRAIQRPVAQRRTIALKGIMRSESVGRATVALEAFGKCADVLVGHKVVIYSADGETLSKAASIKETTGIDIDLLPQTTHDEFVRFLGGTKLSIALNISDGTPNTMLESMMMGAFPIQSDTVSTREWIEHGVNGLLVDPDNADNVANAIRRVIDNDSLLETAATANQAMIREKLQRERLGEEVVEIYRKVLAETV
jgi:glycosyltransferase involved in cell wall biosynthesis